MFGFGLGLSLGFGLRFSVNIMANVESAESPFKKKIKNNVMFA